MSAAMEVWLRARVARDGGVALAEVDAETPIYRYGVDSRMLAFIVESAETEFHVEADLDRISPAEPIRVLIEALRPISP